MGTLSFTNTLKFSLHSLSSFIKQFLLNKYPSNIVSGLSLFKINAYYKGPAIRVRRSSDNAEQDISFNETSLDETSLLNFVGSGDGYLVTYYDQSGNGNDATQGTASNQPKIVDAGTINNFVDGSNLNLPLTSGDKTVLIAQKYGTEFTNTYYHPGSNFNWKQKINSVIVYSTVKNPSIKDSGDNFFKNNLTYQNQGINWSNYDGLTDYTDTLKDSTINWVKKFDTSSGNDFKNFLFGCSNLTSVSEFDTSNGDTFWGFLANCSNLTSVPHFDTSNGNNFRAFLFGCSNLTSVPKFDTSNGNTFFAFLHGCSNLTSVPHFDTSNGNNFRGFLFGCSNLTSVPKFDTSNGNNFHAFLFGCSNLTSLPLFDTSNGDNFRNFLRDCSSLTSVPVLNLSSGTIFNSDTFNGCNLNKESIENIVASLFVNYETQGTAHSIDATTDGSFAATDLDDSRVRNLIPDAPLNYSGTLPTGTTIYQYLIDNGWQISTDL